MARVLIPLPDIDYEPTEAGVPYRELKRRGHEVVIATEHGARPKVDPKLIHGVVFGQLKAEPDAMAAYRELDASPELQEPVSWSGLDLTRFDALVLPGGHAPGMRQYLASESLQEAVAAFWALDRPVAAICHGTLVLARAEDPRTGRSLLEGRTTTCLPKYLERAGYLATFWAVGRYYRTYPAYVEDEVRAALGSGTFVRGPLSLFKKGTASDDSAAFVVEDKNYVSARWPGDAYLFAKRLAERLEVQERASA
jgi:putative intracellular protease/amidase